MNNKENVLEINNETAESMKGGGVNEIITINSEHYETESVQTGVGSIRVVLANMAISDVVERFANTTKMEVSGKDLEAYGFYENLTFVSATVDAMGLVTVVFSIATPEEVRIARLEQTQAEQDEVLAELIGGGGNE